MVYCVTRQIVGHGQTSWDLLYLGELLEAGDLPKSFLFCKTALEILRGPVFSHGFQLLQTQPKLGSTEAHDSEKQDSADFQKLWDLRGDSHVVLENSSS